MVNQNQIENQLWELKKACIQYREINKIADWVLYAVERYIISGKASREFEADFVNYPAENFGDLIQTCLRGDKSDDGIIRSCKTILAQQN